MLKYLRKLASRFKYILNRECITPLKIEFALRFRKKRTLVSQKYKKNNVVFLVFEASLWKLSELYKEFENSGLYHPLILVVPKSRQTHPDKKIISEMEACARFFRKLKYRTLVAFDEGEKEFIKLKSLEANIIIFTNPNKLTHRYYYEDAYKEFFSIYVPYYFMSTNHVGGRRYEHRTPFMGYQNLIYWPHFIAYQDALTHGYNRKNAKLGRYPIVDMIHNSQTVSGYSVVPNKLPKTIIFAPHHTVTDDVSSLATFANYSSRIQDLVEKYAGQVSWIFKPHPLLKEKLFTHSEWGNKRTNEYYDYWRNNKNTSISEATYLKDFEVSDAIIHDCSSFLCEYAFTNKPRLYLTNGKEMNFVNEFGKRFICEYTIASCMSDIENFIEQVIEGEQNWIESWSSSAARGYLSEMPTKPIRLQVLQDIEKER